MSDEHGDQPVTRHGGMLGSDPGERYRRGTRIASGGMGEVWRATDTVLGREVAVKILKSEFADDATFRARFAAEARHAAALHHPGIASVFDYGLLAEGNTPYLVMELVEGKPLSDLLASGQPIDPEQARLLALQVAEALAVAHAAGVVHRDVKPANLLVTPDGRIKITDFGIALATGSVAFTQTGQIVGTPQYLSPEQARGDSATAASDVYALGVVLFECLSGRRPFVADTPIATALAQIQQEVPPLPDGIPPAIATVVMKALAKKPAERYADGAEVALALRGAADGAVPAPAPVPIPTHEATQVLPAVAGAPIAAAPVAAAFVEPTHREPVASTSSQRGSHWPWYAAALLALVVLVALLVARPWADDAGAPTDDGTNASTTPAADTVRVRRAAYLGEPVEEVVAALRERGFDTLVETRDNPGDEEVDTVADVSPSGDVEKGATLTVEAWGAPPEEEPEEEKDNSGKGKGGDEPADPPTSEPSADPSDGTGPAQPDKPGQPDRTVNPGQADKSAAPSGDVQGQSASTQESSQNPTRKGD